LREKRIDDHRRRQLWIEISPQRAILLAVADDLNHRLNGAAEGSISGSQKSLHILRTGLHHIKLSQEVKGFWMAGKFVLKRGEQDLKLFIQIVCISYMPVKDREMVSRRDL
jgi:hypothetical protein